MFYVLQLGVIAQFGFQPNGEGIIQFNQLIKLLEREDQEVGQIKLIKNKLKKQAYLFIN